MAYKTCTHCQTQNGVRTFVCKKCGEPFGPAKKKELNTDVEPGTKKRGRPRKQDIDTTLEETAAIDSTESVDPVLAPVDMIAEVEKGETEQFKFKQYTGTDNPVGTIKTRKTYERPDIEIDRLMKDPDLLKIYPVPAGEPVEHLTAREQAYQVLGLGKKRSTFLLKMAQMEHRWKSVDWKFVAQTLGEAVVEDEPEEVEAGTEKKEE